MHLHPDERFLTMVGIDVKLPPTLGQYLDPSVSSFNPANKGHAFYVYGTFPLLINKLIAQYLYADTYDLFNLQGRVLSGVADFIIVVLIFKLLESGEKALKLRPSVKYLGAFFYAIAVLPIQLSHFFAVDTFLNLFCWLSLYFALKLHARKNEGATLSVMYSSIFLGFAVACKISALYLAPLIGIVVLSGLWRKKPLSIAMLGLMSLTLFYGALRLGSPYYFESNTIMDPRLSHKFIESVRMLQSYNNPDIFPPSNQWVNASPALQVKSIFFFGVGPVYFLLSVWGCIILFRKKNPLIASVILWACGLLVYQSFQVAKTMRYLILIYPFLAILAAVGFEHLTQKFKKVSAPQCYMLHVTCYMLILVWPLAFMSVYTKDHSRVTASKWIYEHIPPKSTIAYEYWDDPLPLMVQDPTERDYQSVDIHIFDADTPAKWNTINKQLDSVDYYIMSSNRGWGSIQSTPERYPIASEFYTQMIRGNRGFALIKQFSSYPSLDYLGIPIAFPDQWAEEAFTVYDHPLVYIFKKNN